MLLEPRTMPYVVCPTCDLTVYSAAKVSTVDECPRCGTMLGRTGSDLPYAAPPTLPLEPARPQRGHAPRRSPGRRPRGAVRVAEAGAYTPPHSGAPCRAGRGLAVRR